MRHRRTIHPSAFGTFLPRVIRPLLASLVLVAACSVRHDSEHDLLAAVEENLTPSGRRAVLGEDVDVDCPDYSDRLAKRVFASELSSAPSAAVGSASGRFSVSSSGTAEYDIAIAAVPGRAGIQPM